jgi:hypothetical protein
LKETSFKFRNLFRTVLFHCWNNLVILFILHRICFIIFVTIFLAFFRSYRILVSQRLISLIFQILGKCMVQPFADVASCFHLVYNQILSFVLHTLEIFRPILIRSIKPLVHLVRDLLHLFMHSRDPVVAQNSHMQAHPLSALKLVKTGKIVSRNVECCEILR